MPAPKPTEVNARRRLLLAAGGLIALPRLAAAQASGKVAKIGYLGNSTTALESHFIEAFVRGMQSLGYAEGRNFAISYLWAEGKNERLPDLAAEFVQFTSARVTRILQPGFGAWRVFREVSSGPEVDTTMPSERCDQGVPG